MNASPAAGTVRPHLTFWGAAQTVTGSLHLLETGQGRVLLDCGLFQGRRSEMFRRNSKFPFRASDIDAVLLTHAHIDHCGNLPNLVRQGFRGPVYCTAATRELATIMLADSAKVQEEDAMHTNIVRQYAEPWVHPLYTTQDANRAASLCVSTSFGETKELIPGMTFRFENAGHVLGSAMVHLSIEDEGQSTTLTYTGDLGRAGMPFLRPPLAVPPADTVITECTYGGPCTSAVGSNHRSVCRRIASHNLTRRQGAHPGLRPRPNPIGHSLSLFVDGPRIGADRASLRRQPAGQPGFAGLSSISQRVSRRRCGGKGSGSVCADV